MEFGVRVVVDGMTGVGKTSLMELMVGQFGFRSFIEIFRDENDLLGKYYNEGRRWCFPMQLSFLNNRYSQYKDACQLGNAIMDRSIYSDPIFASLYHKTGDMEPEEYFVYKSLFGTLVDSLQPPELVVYLEVSVEEAIRRIQLRAREDEMKMPLSYWRNLHEVYTEYYKNYRLAPLLRINVEKMDFVNNPQDRQKILNIIREWYGDKIIAREYA